MTFFIHFTIGPVQSFVGQARRTRDFWGGSFLLSWLAGVAMRELQAQKCRIEFPEIDSDNEFLQFVGCLPSAQDPVASRRGDASSCPRQGTIPNRFTASGENINPKDVENAVQTAWSTLANLVLKEDLQQLYLENTATQSICKRQIENFWDITWVLTEEEHETMLIDRRKNIRQHVLPDEPGNKCTVMDGWQELSSICGVRGKDRIQREEFWNAIRTKTGSLDLADHEELCAIAYVKRRFAKHFHKLQVAMPGGWHLRGWALDANVPSVVYMAAVHWLTELITSGDREHIIEILDIVNKLDYQKSEMRTDIACIRKACEDRRDLTAAAELAKHDGKLFFPCYLSQPKLYEPQSLATNLIHKLRDQKKTGTSQREPSPYYALLFMDGDDLGKRLREPGNCTVIAEGIEEFCRNIKGQEGVVCRNNGFLVYAGGDDVIAILPFEDALPCASAIREAYMGAFRGKQIAGDTAMTISAAIEFVHVKVPLGKVFSDLHQLLDDIAKDRCGRDAIAIRLWNTGGMMLEWAQPWSVALADNGELVLHQLMKKFQVLQGQEENSGARFSSKFFYRVRELMETLYPQHSITGVSDTEATFAETDLCNVLAAELLSSGINRNTTHGARISMENAVEDYIAPLIQQCWPKSRKAGLKEHSNSTDENSTVLSMARTPQADAALLVRHLVLKGVER